MESSSDTWRNLKWGDLVELKYGKSLKGYKDNQSGVPVFGTNGQVGFCSQVLCDFPSIIIGRKGAYRGVHFSDEPFYVIDTAFYIVPKVPLNIKWAYYELLTQDINGLDSGSAIPSTRREDFYSLPVKVPPLQYQDKLVNILDNLNFKVRLNQNTNQTLEQMAQALFKSWFVDFDPVVDNALAAGNPIPDELVHRVEVRKKAYALPASLEGKGQPLPEHIRNLFPNEFEQTGEPTVGIGGWVPKGWDIKPINNVGEIVCGKTPSKSNPDFYGEDVPFIKIPDMHGNMLITETSDSLSYEGDSSQPKKRIPKNSICVSCIATVGLVSITTEPSHTNQQINSIVPIDTAQVEYLYFQMKGLNKKFHDLASGGSATLNMNTRTFGSIDILVPNQVVINEFHNRVSSLVSKIELCKRESKQLASIRDSLLPKLISGEIQLEPASKNIQEAELQGV